MDSNVEKKPEFEPPEEEVRKLAKELQGVVAAGVLEKLRDVDLKASEFEDFFRGMLRESDTVLAIVGWSYIDDRLRDLFSQVINPDITGGSKSIFGALGPLGASSSRIQMAAALDWLDKTTYLNLHLIRKVRNEFAHGPFSRTFEENRISGLLSSMVAIEEAALTASAAQIPGRETVTSRQRIYIRFMLTCQTMILEMVTAPHAIRSGLPPFSVIATEWGSLPVGVKELYRATARLVFECLANDSAGEIKP